MRRQTDRHTHTKHLDVAVGDPIGVQEAEPAQHLLRVEEGYLVGKGAESVQEQPHRTPRHELQEDVHLLALDAAAVRPHDIFVPVFRISRGRYFSWQAGYVRGERGAGELGGGGSPSPSSPRSIAFVKIGSHHGLKVRETQKRTAVAPPPPKTQSKDMYMSVESIGSDPPSSHNMLTGQAKQQNGMYRIPHKTPSPPCTDSQSSVTPHECDCDTNRHAVGQLSSSRQDLAVSTTLFFGADSLNILAVNSTKLFQSVQGGGILRSTESDQNDNRCVVHTEKIRNPKNTIPHRMITV